MPNILFRWIFLPFEIARMQTRLCPTAHCRLHWMRKASDLLYWAIGPTEDEDSHLLMETTHWNGVKVVFAQKWDLSSSWNCQVRIYYPRDRAKAESDGAIIYTHGGGFSIWSTEMWVWVDTIWPDQDVTLFSTIQIRITDARIGQTNKHSTFRIDRLSIGSGNGKGNCGIVELDSMSAWGVSWWSGRLRACAWVRVRKW